MRPRLFQKRFVPLIQSGKKNQTIRKYPKCELPKRGDKESLRYWIGTPRRSKQQEFAVRTIKDVTTVAIGEQGASFFIHRGVFEIIDLDAFAKADGFKDWDEMVQWFKAVHELPFKGILIEYEPPEQ